MSYYYQMLKEERICRLKTIANNSDEILHTLNEIEKTEGIEDVLPFYDEIIEIILMGECVDSEKSINIISYII